MLEIFIPGYNKLQIEYLVLDYNGTIAVDGELLDGVRERLEALTSRVAVHVLTADTFGNARSGLKDVPCELAILPAENQAEAKHQYVKGLGPDSTVCIGNGRNDRLMLETDAPYLLPRDLVPKPASRRNEPRYLPHILETVAACRNEDPLEVAAATTRNALGFFGFPTE